jgi:hypothetical protein
MPRSLILLFALAASAAAQIWPESWGASKRLDAAPINVEETGLWAEYQGEAAERATYSGPMGKFVATAWRLNDATAALAFYQAKRPAKAVPVTGAIAVSLLPSGQILAHDNFVLMFEGWRPLDAEMAVLYKALPLIRSGGGIPPWPGYLPEKNRVRNSERYLLGVSSLQKFLPEVSAALAPNLDDDRVVLGDLNLRRRALSYFERPELLANFLSVLERKLGDKVWIFHLHATGGAGKTMFLRWLTAPNQWFNIAAPPPATVPGSRTRALATWDPAANALVAAGGLVMLGPQVLTDTWLWRP